MNETSIPDLHDVLAAAEAAAQALFELVGASFEMFTCDEAESFAGLIHLFGGQDRATQFLDWHGASDEDPVDLHHDRYLSRQRTRRT